MNRKRRVEANDAIKEKAYNEILERIRNHKKSIEKRVYHSIGKRIQLL